MPRARRSRRRPATRPIPAFVDGWVAAAIERFGRIDVLYNGVGISRSGLIADVSDDDWRFQQRMTLDTVFYATRAVLPHMVEQGSGSIVSMSSGAGIGGNYGLGAYGAAKAGVINLMETVAMEYGPHGVRANAVTPGPTATAPMLAWVEQQPGGEAAHARELDLQRLSRPDEVANTRAVPRLRRGVERHRHRPPQQHPCCREEAGVDAVPGAATPAIGLLARHDVHACAATIQQAAVKRTSDPST